jgi:hypothetical protein
MAEDANEVKQVDEPKAIKDKETGRGLGNGLWLGGVARRR